MISLKWREEGEEEEDEEEEVLLKLDDDDRRAGGEVGSQDWLSLLLSPDIWQGSSRPLWIESLRSCISQRPLALSLTFLCRRDAFDDPRSFVRSFVPESHQSSSTTMHVR